MKQLSNSITVGHRRAADGSATVYLALDNERVALTAKGARKVAAQLLEWAEHVDEWKALVEEQRAKLWLEWTSDSVEAWTVAPSGDAEHGAEETP